MGQGCDLQKELVDSKGPGVVAGLRAVSAKAADDAQVVARVLAGSRRACQEAPRRRGPTRKPTGVARGQAHGIAGVPIMRHILARARREAKRDSTGDDVAKGRTAFKVSAGQPGVHAHVVANDDRLARVWVRGGNNAGEGGKSNWQHFVFACGRCPVKSEECNIKWEARHIVTHEFACG